jgi:hypothetical protein
MLSTSSVLWRSVMRPVRLVAAVSLAFAATFAVSTAPDAHASPPPSSERGGYTFAVIGDVPYGAAQIAAFPGWIQQINADPDVRSVVHVGDIKNGSSLCATDYFRLIRSDFDTFQDPLVYTPGDNEWTDCHRANNGGYNPLERLATVRSLFFDHPGTSLGQTTMPLHSQASIGIPENVAWTESGIRFLTVNIPGSNNGL